MPDPERFDADVHIRHVPTGEVRVYRSEEPLLLGFGDEKPEWHSFWWQAGNASCDCNRWLFFERAAGNDPDMDRMVCGDGTYHIDRIVRVSDGAVLWEEP